MRSRYARGVSAVLIGMALNALGDALLGVRIEQYSGISTFTIWWMLDVFLVPFIVGLAVARLFGRGSKWLACLPPILVRGLSYLYFYHSTSQADFFWDLHLFYWGPCVILNVESANFGAILGEVLVGVYGRPRPGIQPAK
jgi:hypothetical protein